MPSWVGGLQSLLMRRSRKKLLSSFIAAQRQLPHLQLGLTLGDAIMSWTNLFHFTFLIIAT